MTNKQKKKYRKVKWGVMILFIIVIFASVIVVSGFQKAEIEREVRQMNDEIEMYKYNAKMFVEQQKETVSIKEDKMIVCLDPGHGGKDPGSMAGDRMEKDENLKMALQIKKNLEKNGIEVILTRGDDTYPSLKKRAKIANRQEADLFVSLHRNYLTGYPEINGIDVYVNCQTSEADYVIGNALCKQLTEVGGMNVNELKIGSATDANENYTVVAKTNMTACLVEMGYMSNSRDNEYYDDYFNAYSIAITEAIWEYMQYDSALSADMAN